VVSPQESLPRSSGFSQPLLDRLGADNGRKAAIGLLALLALAQIAFGEAGWSQARNIWFDAFQQVAPRAVTHLPAVIIDIDDESLQQFGRWPWPRTRLAQLIEETHRLGALAVGLDMILPEADSQSPQRLLAERQDATAQMRQALAALPSNDAILAKTLRQVPSVLGRAALIDAPSGKASPASQTPALIAGESPQRFAPAYDGQILNLPELETAAHGRGYLNDSRDGDGIVRSMPLVLSVNGAIAPAFAVELLRVASGQTGYSVRSNDQGIVGVQIGTSFIPTDRDGRLRVYYSTAHGSRRLSAAAILGGAVAPKALVNQVAIVGATAVGISDVAATPVGSRMDGVEIHAQLVENILFGARLMRPPMARWWELFELLAFGVVLIVALPRRRPAIAVALYCAIGATLVLVSFVAFLKLRTLYDPTLAVAANGAVAGLILTAGYTAAERRRRELDAELAIERNERLRAAGELRAAREIQMGMLPDPESIDGMPANLNFFALLEPAQEVGGDLYDAFMLDDRRLFFMIGDVSGKGVPASLFMALTKTLCKSLARRQPLNLGQVLSSVNDEISRENPTTMFVTAIIGVIDAGSGEVELCNAGHNPAILVRAQELSRELDGAGGPPLCLDRGFTYPTQRLRLADGDMLLLITDGVTEAEDRRQGQFGLARTLQCLAGAPRLSAAGICHKLHAEVKHFTMGAMPSDDLTLLAVRFSVPPTTQLEKSKPSM
jgi:serine phosphatase RsbU (regulator of sigma subunit)/CHASE2 domain-containing sensor protein